ncbi:hypothetical protein EW145_g7598 [Phellinidium pouzarii]|uniref:DUF2415 domain-containing protein n=1 Tax=Phellinidium pouzarii TaxID=167371 RepID=A0A4S4KHB0_9AGAM|nr:hypothetical protein EW145_g7598 [Phellinidium pouzarii]
MEATECSVPPWHPPQSNMSSMPNVVASGSPQKGGEYPNNFFRCAKWCPDGSRALAQCEDRSLQMLQLPAELVENAMVQIGEYPVLIDISSAPANMTMLSMTKSQTQYSDSLHRFWTFPGILEQVPAILVCIAFWLLLENVRSSYWMQWTAGRCVQLRASYKIVDHRERQVAPHSMTFNGMATHVYCGYEDAIEVFDFQRPGEGSKLPTTPSKKSRDGMKGIVSSIAFCPDYSGLFAASSLSSAITLFTEATGEDPVAYLDGMSSAITQVKFDPARPHLLYAAQRRSDEILCWDVREPLEVLQRFSRSGRRSNQKRLFDIDPAGQWLASGDEDGCISLFDLAPGRSDGPAMKFKAHDGAFLRKPDHSVGSVAFSPIDSSLLSVSGSRHFHTTSATTPSAEDGQYDSDTDESASSDSYSNTDPNQPDASDKRHGRAIRRRRQPARPFVKDSSAKVWKFSTVSGEIQVDSQS